MLRLQCAPAPTHHRSVYAGGKFPLSTYLAEQVRGMLADPARWKRLPEQVADWLRLQQEKSVLPRRDELLVETFPRGNRHYMVAYPFEGRLAHQTLGMLLTRRLERAGARPLGFVATDYSLAVWALGRHGGDVPAQASRRSRSCSTRTCWATISTPGWPRAGCSSAPSATAR